MTSPINNSRTTSSQPWMKPANNTEKMAPENSPKTWRRPPKMKPMVKAQAETSHPEKDQRVEKERSPPAKPMSETPTPEQTISVSEKLRA